MCEFIIKINIFIFIIMDNSNISNSILPSTNATLDSAVSTTSSSATGEGFFGFIKNMSATTWFIIILIFAFLGFNIFAYLAKGTQDIANLFGPFFKEVFGITLLATGKVVDVTAEGAKAVVNTTAGVLDTGLTAVQNITPDGSKSSISPQTVQSTISQPDVMANNSLNKVLNTHQTEQQGQDYQANEASSSVHLAGGKGGWCYIGEDRGFRSCVEVSGSDQCMSGDIFPSKDICVNPSLRA
uniref:Uncharacterized protein n=1 Tax=viral metagenome TaxID=1070528 RepID=A0A6C0ICT8_9ZZZZ